MCVYLRMCMSICTHECVYIQAIIDLRFQSTPEGSYLLASDKKILKVWDTHAMCDSGTGGEGTQFICVRACVSGYIYKYIHIYMYIHINIYLCIDIDIHIYIYIYIYICI